MPLNARMRMLRFDPVGGASGDMILAALIDLGVPVDRLLADLRTLPVEAFDIAVEAVHAGGLTGRRAGVSVPPSPHEHAAHRTFATIRKMIDGSALPDAVKSAATAVFHDLAKAEGRVHGKDPEDVHFHEVGALDSIVDIVGACDALAILHIDAVACGPLPLGAGTVQTAHGILPVPAPATVELLRGHPVLDTGDPFEMVTPTGAALLTTWQRLLPAPAAAPWTLARCGQGFGHREMPGRPNLLRALLFEDPPSPPPGDSCLVMECNLDDTVPELLGSLCRKLMDDGALDVFTTAIQMKKQRPGTLLTVLCRPERRDTLLDMIFRESTTFGVREYLTQRAMLERRQEVVQTPFGAVRIKIGRWRGQDVTRSPEHEDCSQLARQHGVSVRSVYEAAQQAAGSAASSEHR